MGEQRRRRWNTYFTRLFVTFSLVIIVLTSTCGIVFDKMMQEYAQDRIGEVRRGSQAGLEKYMQELTDGLQRDALNLSQILAQSGLTDKTQALYELRAAQAKLAAAARTNSMLSSVYLYLERTEYVLTSYHGGYSREVFLDQEWYESYRKLTMFNNSLWMPVRTIQAPQGAGNGNTGSPVLTYIYSLYSFTTPGIKGALVYNIDEKQLINRLNAGYDRKDEYVRVLDPEGKVVCDLNRQLLGTDLSQENYVERILSSPQDSGYFTLPVEGESMLVSWYKSAFNQWIFVDFTSMETMNAMVNSYMGGLILGIFGILAVGIVAVFWLSRYLYNPIRQLSEEIFYDHTFAGTEEDLTLLKRAISTMKQREERIRKRQIQSEKELEEYYLRTLILSGYREEAMPESLKTLAQSRPLYIAYLQFCLRDERWRQMEEQEQCYFRDLLSQVLSQMLEEEHRNSRAVHMGRQGMYTLIFGAEETQIKDILERYIQYVKENFEIQLSIGISSCDCISRVATAAEQALEASEQVFFRRWGHVIAARDVPADGTQDQGYPWREEQDLLECLEAGNETLIRRAVHDYCGQLKKMPGLTAERGGLMLHQLTGSVLKKISERLEMLEPLTEFRQRVYQIFSIPGYSLWEFETEFCDCLCALPFVQGEDARAGEELFRQMQAYIQEYYRENIGANEVAEALQISYSYTRKVFKEHAGISPSDYIHQLRIQEAKRLLRATSKPVARISQEVGYNSDQSFLRTFKKLVGVSPATYRKGGHE